MKCFYFAVYTWNIIQINFTKLSNYVFYHSELHVVSPCTRKYEAHNARRVACVLHHLNYLKIESVAQLCDVSQKMKISASGTYFMLKKCPPFTVILQITCKRASLCGTLTRFFYILFWDFWYFRNLYNNPSSNVPYKKNVKIIKNFILQFQWDTKICMCLECCTVYIK